MFIFLCCYEEHEISWAVSECWVNINTSVTEIQNTEILPSELASLAPGDLHLILTEMDKRAPMRFGKRMTSFTKKAPMRFGKRAPMRFGKRAPMRFGKRAPMRFGKRDSEEPESIDVAYEDTYFDKRAPMRFGKRSDLYDYWTLGREGEGVKLNGLIWYRCSSDDS